VNQEQTAAAVKSFVSVAVNDRNMLTNTGQSRVRVSPDLSNVNICLGIESEQQQNAICTVAFLAKTVMQKYGRKNFFKKLLLSTRLNKKKIFFLVTAEQLLNLTEVPQHVIEFMMSMEK
jgi:hypothetical protein